MICALSSRVFVMPASFGMLAFLSLMGLAEPEDQIQTGKKGLLEGKLSIVPELPKSVKIEHSGTIEYSPESQMVTYIGEPLVKIRSNSGTEIFAHEARLDLKTKQVLASGGVSVFQGNSLTRAESVTFNWETNQLEMDSLRTKVDVLLLESGKFQSGVIAGKRYFQGKNAGVTTEDVENPSTWLRSDMTTVWPGDRVDFQNLKIYVGNVPVFYLPKFSRSLNPEVGWYPRPGSRSEWGMFLLNRYGVILGKKETKHGYPSGPYIGSFDVDLRSRRGVGGGFSARNTDFERDSDFSGLKTYYTYDTNPNVLILGVQRAQIPDPERWLWQLRERFEIGDQEAAVRWRVDTDFTGVSDRYLLEDFFPEEYSNDPKPDNELHVVRTTDQSVLTGMARVDLNHFYPTNSKLPEITYDRIRGSLAGTDVIYESTTSFANLKNNLPNWEKHRLDDLIDSLPDGNSTKAYYESLRNTDRFSRFNTYHEFALPKRVSNVVNIVPKVGGGYTGYYGLDGADNTYNRGLLFSGINVDTKFSRTYDGVKNRALGLDGLLHVFEPYTQYSFVHTNQFDGTIPSVDGYTASTRPDALSVGRFTQVDDLASWSVQRFGVRNMLMTRRDGISVPWLMMDSYFEAFYRDPEMSRNYSNLYNDITWTPVRWTRLNLETQFPISNAENGFTEVNTNLGFMPTRELEIELGHRFLSGHPILEDANLINLAAMVRLNRGWAVGARYRWEIEEGNLELQEYTLWRDTGAWAVGVGLYERNNKQNDKSDYGVMISFVLKEFPDIKMPMKLN